MKRAAAICAGFFALSLVPASAAEPAMDYPGKHFQVTPADMPKPFATPAVENSSKTVPRPANAMPRVPKGFAISIFADRLSHPRWMAVAPNGDVFLSEPDAGKISLLRDAKGTGHATVTTFATGFTKPHGLAFHDGALYVGDQDAVWKVAYTDGAMKAGARTRITKQHDLGIGGHFTRDIAFGPDGSLYLGIGSTGNVDTTEPIFRAAVNKVEADGSLTQFATGTRNPVGLTFYPSTNNLWITVNERDGLGDQLVPDYFTHIVKGGFYGWPYAYIGHNVDPTVGSQRPDMVAKATVPDLLFQSHSAPLGVVFYEGAQFPSDYKGDAFVSLHGSWNNSKPTGYKVVRVHFANSMPVGGYDDFVTGFRVEGSNPAQVWGRPAGLAVAKDGALLIADDAGKRVWRVTYTGK
jgi:glucose/arabinose dehydrogenase